jgi:hypothetical protein
MILSKVITNPYKTKSSISEQVKEYMKEILDGNFNVQEIIIQINYPKRISFSFYLSYVTNKRKCQSFENFPEYLNFF